MEGRSGTQPPLESAGETPRPSNLFVRIGQVFFSPGALFESLRARPVWIDVMIVLLVATIASQVLIPEERYREIFMQQMPPDSDPEDAERLMGFLRQWGIAVAAIWLPLATATIAGFISLAYNVILGGEARFSQLFSAVAHSLLILTAGGFVVLGLLIAGGEQVVLSPALLLPELGDGYIARFLSRINVFAVWTCVVLGIAISKFYPKRTAFGGTTYLLVLYLALTAASAIPGG